MAISEQLGEEKVELVKSREILSRFDMVLFFLSAILALDTFALVAGVGPVSLSWWVIALIVFFMPYGVIIVELTTRYPERGGLYVWVKRAFGGKWAARTTWLYWINVALWIPSVYLLFSQMVSQLFFPEMGIWLRVVIGVVVTWLTVGATIISLRYGKWIANSGALLKVLMMGVLIAVGVIYAVKSGIPNDFSLRNVMPNWTTGLAFLPIIAYNFMGFELLASASDEIKHLKTNFPRAVLIAGTMIALFYILGTLSFLMIFRVSDLEAIKSVMDALWVVFGEGGLGGVLVSMFGVITLYIIISSTVCWVLGANRMIARAAQEGELPSVFGKPHPVYHTPLGASLVMGLVSTGVVLTYGLLASGNKEPLFRLLFAFSSLLYLLPYLIVFPTYLKLRRSDIDFERSNNSRLSHPLAAFAVVICELFVLQAIIFFIWRPGEVIEWSFAGTALLGVLLVFIAGEIMLEVAALQKRSSPKN